MTSHADTRYVSLETFRRSGEGVRTPVWFAEHDGRIYVRTFAKLGKAKRLQRDRAVRVAPCDRAGVVLGDWRAGQARLLRGAEARAADRHITRRQGLIKRVADLVYPVRYGRAVVIEIELVPSGPSQSARRTTRGSTAMGRSVAWPK